MNSSAAVNGTLNNTIPVKEVNDHSLPIPHTFLIIGNRGYGFWPKNSGWPESPGQVHNDFYHPWQEGRQYMVTPDQLAALLASINANLNDWYDVSNLFGYNCTGWADAMLANAGITGPQVFTGPAVENPWTH